MRRFSRRHYRAVSPPADTQAEIVARLIRQRACELGRADREREFLFVTFDNFDAATAYQEARIAFHSEKLSDGTRPNWGRTAEQIRVVVYSSIAGPHDGTPDRREEVVARILETGEGAWHASSVVFGYVDRCQCVPCCKLRGEAPVRI